MLISNFALDFPTTAKRLLLLVAADPENMNFHHSNPEKALPWPKTRRLSYRILQSVAWFGRWFCGRNNKYVCVYIYIYIYIYIHTSKNAHMCYISPLRRSVISQLIVLKFSTLLDLTYVISSAMFGE